MSEVAVGVQGVNLGRDGELSLLEIYGEDEMTYVFDIKTLQDSAFQEGHLVKILESRHIRKVVYDIRSACDSLHHHYNVSLENIYDLQVLYQVVHNERSSHLKRFDTALCAPGVVDPSEIDFVRIVKAKGKAFYQIEKGGSPTVWNDRPLHRNLLRYLALNLKYTMRMKSLWKSKATEHFVRSTSEARVWTMISSPIAVFGGSRMGICDFSVHGEAPANATTPGKTSASPPSSRVSAKGSDLTNNTYLWWSSPCEEEKQNTRVESQELTQFFNEGDSSTKTFMKNLNSSMKNYDEVLFDSLNWEFWWKDTLQADAVDENLNPPEKHQERLLPKRVPVRRLMFQSRPVSPSKALDTVFE
jgi:hypothetical protein